MRLLPLLAYCFLSLMAAATVPTGPLHAPAGQTPPQAALASKWPQFLVGDTVYVAASGLNVRARPRADGTGNIALTVSRNTRGTVIALPNRNWAQVEFMSEDVGFEGYVSQWYLAKAKTKAGK
ncbi:SH3 domain-containing protein [Hymenobacter rubidus]|uniref:SH3 domain-containing protein n=1 Tax=Hymenobacter rubidus TaxID=1441626 RepID=UPI00191CB4A9|nr:SH3 domain-containing protein [Hymenobacter rubidus]